MGGRHLSAVGHANHGGWETRVCREHSIMHNLCEARGGLGGRGGVEEWEGEGGGEVLLSLRPWARSERIFPHGKSDANL